MTFTPLIPANRALLALTNRTDGFAWEQFNAPLPFTPMRDEADALSVKVRGLLDLGRKTDDYVVRLSLAILGAHVHATEALQDIVRTYRLCEHPMRDFRTSGGSLVASGLTGPPGIKHRPLTWPVHQRATLTCTADTTRGMLSYEGRKVVVETLDLGDDAGRLQVQWPADFGIKGLIGLDGQAWEEGRIWQVDYDPLQPADGVLDAVLANDACMLIVARQGLSGLMAAARDTMERHACVLMALASSNTSVYSRG